MGKKVSEIARLDMRRPDPQSMIKNRSCRKQISTFWNLSLFSGYPSSCARLTLHDGLPWHLIGNGHITCSVNVVRPVFFRTLASPSAINHTQGRGDAKLTEKDYPAVSVRFTRIGYPSVGDQLGKYDTECGSRSIRLTRVGYSSVGDQLRK